MKDEYITACFREKFKGEDRLFSIILFTLYEENKHTDPYCLVRYVPYDILSKLKSEQNFEILPKFDIRAGFSRKQFFQKILYEFSVYIRYFGLSARSKILADFDLFCEAYDEIIKDRKNFISHKLVLYVILRHNDLQCSVDEFQPLKFCHINICEQVLEKLKWKNIYFPINKRMEEIKTIKEVGEQFAKFVLENCKTKEEMMTLLESVQNAILGADTCDPKTNTCSYVMKKGNSKGQVCGKPSKSQFCSKHTTRMFNFERKTEDS